MVYCSDEFSRMMGYPRCDIMQSPAAGDFMAGALTDAATVGRLRFRTFRDTYTE